MPVLGPAGPAFGGVGVEGLFWDARLGSLAGRPRRGSLDSPSGTFAPGPAKCPAGQMGVSGTAPRWGPNQALGFAVETRVHSLLGPFLPYIFLLIITAPLSAKLCVGRRDYKDRFCFHSFIRSFTGSAH